MKIDECLRGKHAFGNGDQQDHKISGFIDHKTEKI
jgi:hypothetical protein